MDNDEDVCLDVQTRQLQLIIELSMTARDLADRSKVDGLELAERIALRNRAKLANEHAGALLARGSIDLFNQPPDDAVERINRAINGTNDALRRIERVRGALSLAASLIGVAAAVLTGDWQAIVKSVSALEKKKGDAPSPA